MIGGQVAHTTLARASVVRRDAMLGQLHYELRSLFSQTYPPHSAPDHMAIMIHSSLAMRRWESTRAHRPSPERERCAGRDMGARAMHAGTTDLPSTQNEAKLLKF